MMATKKTARAKSKPVSKVKKKVPAKSVSLPPVKSVLQQGAELKEAIAAKRKELELLELAQAEQLNAAADAVGQEILGQIQLYGASFSGKTRRALLAALGKADKVSGKEESSKEPAKVKPKYRLPGGITWTGRGRTPKAFMEWQKANPGKDYPPA